VSGTITDSGTALPLSGAAVAIYRQTSATSVAFVKSGSTNASGVYMVSGLQTGTYYALASAAGHVIEVYDNMPCTAACTTADILAGTPIAVVAGSVTSGRDFALDPGGSITGMVTNAVTSAPLVNAQVNVYTRVGGSPQFVDATSTNSTGGWTVAGLPTGVYYAFTSTFSANVRYTNEIYNDIACPISCSSTTATSSGTPISVTAGATTSGINFALSPSTSPPGAPSNFGATVSGFVARFSWNPSTTGGLATSYVIQAGLSSGTTIVSIPATGTSIDIPGVPPGTFYVRVRAVNSFGMSVASNEYVLIVNADGSGVLGAPQTFSARMNGGRLTVTWSDPTFGGVAASYVLEVGTAAGQSNLVALPVASRSFTFEPVPPGVYFLRVRSANGAQLSPPSGEAMIVVGNVPSPPEAPRSLTHTLTGSTLTLSWLAPFFGTPTSYILEAGTASGLVDIIVFNTGSTAVTISVSGVPSGTYYVRVRAVNALGTSVASNERIISVP
jgi:predicted phage tail protein